MKYTLYQDPTCPFCRLVKNFLAARNLEIPQKDTWRDLDAYRELVKGGGRGTVPCLRIQNDADGTERWMYESQDIMAYLDTTL